jgi:subtilisin family serine protease
MLVNSNPIAQSSLKSIKIRFSLFICSSMIFAANAENRIYRLNDISKIESLENKFDVQSQKNKKIKSSSLKIIDSIPQLGLVLMAQQDGDKLGADDLGANKLIQLKLPNKKRMNLPSGFWGLKAIEANKAWAIAAGAGVTVAVSDTGIDSTHKDLAQNMWVNPGEDGVDAEGKNRRTNGKDDDENGYIDDVHGWDFVNGSGSVKDNQYHGTHVAGTIAAAYSDKISGVAPYAKLMSVPFLSSKGSGTEFNGAKTIVYAADHGAKIVNCSWGAEGSSPVIEEAVRYAAKKGVLVIAAAGNSKVNIDRTIHTPAAITLDNIVSVGATSGLAGNKASYSNFGAINVDLAAPGSNIKSTSPKNGTKVLSGTSMATPHVSGVAAVLWSIDPTLTADEVKSILMESTVKKTTWRKKSQSEGVLNANNAVQMLLSGTSIMAAIGQ